MPPSTVHNRAIDLRLLVLSLVAACGRGDLEGRLTLDLPLAGMAADSVASTYIDATPVGQGMAYLADTPPFVSLLDSTGTLIRQFGEPGEGPGQLQTPTALMTVDSTLALWEPTRRLLTLFDIEGRYRGTISLPGAFGGTTRNARTNFYSHPGLIRAIGGTWVAAAYPSLVAQPADQLSLSLIAVDARGQHSDTLWRGGAAPSPAGRPSRAPRELLPIPLWAACPDGSIVTFDPTTQEILSLSSQGQPGPSRRAPPAGVALTTDGLEKNVGFQIRRLLRAARRSVPPDFDHVVHALTAENVANGMYPDVFQGFSGLLCTGGGTIWLQTFSLDDSPLGTGRSWLVLRPAEPTLTLVFPVGFRPLALTPGRAYGVVLDSLTDETPAWVMLPPDLASQPH